MNKLILTTIALLLLQGCSPALSIDRSKEAIKYCKHKGTELEFIKTQGGDVTPSFKCVGMKDIINVYDAKTYLRLEGIK